MMDHDVFRALLALDSSRGYNPGEGLTGSARHGGILPALLTPWLDARIRGHDKWALRAAAFQTQGRLTGPSLSRG